MRTFTQLVALHGALVLAACSVAPVTFTPDDHAPSDGGVGFDTGEPIDAVIPDGRIAEPGMATITITRSGAATGSVSAAALGLSCGNTCSAAVPVGTTVTLQASPDTGALFGGWSGGCTGGEPSCTVTVNADLAIGARFDLPPVTVTVMVRGNAGGLVVSSPAGVMCPSACTASFPAGTSITLTAMPAPGASFAGWTGACSDVGSCSITPTTDTSVTAAFASNDLLVARAGTGRGTVTSNPVGIACGTDCVQNYPLGTEVTLTAVAAADSTFAGWSGAGCTGTAPCKVTMNAAATVTATFTIRGGLVTILEQGAVLQRLDPVSLAVTDIGPIGVTQSLGDCAWDPANATLYFVDGFAARSLYRLDLATGAATLVGLHTPTELLTLAYHPPTNQLYAVDYGDRNLYSIDPTTGASTLVGPTGAPQLLDGLAWDSRRNVMTAMIAGTGEMYSINVATGAATRLTQVTPTGISNLGMTYDSVLDRFWGVDRNGSVFQLDPNNGFARTNIGSAGVRTCVAFIP